MATRFTAPPQRPRFHTASAVQPWPRRRAEKPSTTGMMYARYRATVLSDVTIGTAPLHAIAARLAATIAQMAGPGVPSLGCTRRKRFENGVPLSLASA